MIFEFESNAEGSTIRAHFELSDRHIGHRQEGSFDEIRYSGDDITFDYGVRSIHPDLLGLLCLIIFYPFIGQRVVLPMPVSRRLVKAFDKASFDRPFRFDNVDPGLDRYRGSKTVLSFGGGIDSTAVRVMFPEAYVVQEAHLREGQLAPSRSHEVVRSLGPDRGALVTSNQRFVSRPGGWHGWTCAFATSLLMATDYDFGMVLMGATISSTLLAGGTRYWNRFGARRWHGSTGNYWQSAFDEIGLPVFSPVCGVSGYVTMKLSLDLLRRGAVFFCTSRDGAACLQCVKCLRRELIRSVIEPGYQPVWEPYDRPEVHTFLERRPLQTGHIFAYARGRSPDLPTFLTSRMRGLPKIKSGWPTRVHAPTFELCDPTWRTEIRDRVLSHVKPMNRKQLRELKRWDTHPRARRTTPWRAIARIRG